MRRRLLLLLVSSAAICAWAPVTTSAASPPTTPYRQAVSDAYDIVSQAATGDVQAAHQAAAVLQAGTGTSQPEVLADLAKQPPDFKDAGARLQALLGALDHPAASGDPAGDQAKLHQVLTMHQYDALHRPPSALDRLGQWLNDRVKELLRLLFGGNSIGGVIPTWVVYVIGILVIALIGFVVFRSTRGRFGSDIAALSAGGPRAPADFFADADRLAAKGDRVAALRALCAGVAATLAGERTWEGSPLTVREIFQRAPDPASLAPSAPSVRGGGIRRSRRRRRHLRARGRGGGAVSRSAGGGRMRGARGWAFGALLIVGLLVVVLTAQQSADSPEHSSNSDAANGTSALRLFAAALGHPTDQIAGSFQPPSSDGMMFVFTPTSAYTFDEAASTVSWVRQGGVLVYASETGDPELDNAFGVQRVQGYVTSTTVQASGPVAEGVTQVAGGNLATPFTVSPTQVAILRAGPYVVAYLQRIGSGTVVVLADPLELGNGYLDKADNGRLAADILGLAGGSAPVAFDEFHHGLTTTRPVAASVDNHTLGRRPALADHRGLLRAAAARPAIRPAHSAAGGGFACGGRVGGRGGRAASACRRARRDPRRSCRRQRARRRRQHGPRRAAAGTFLAGSVAAGPRGGERAGLGRARPIWVIGEREGPAPGRAAASPYRLSGVRASSAPHPVMNKEAR